MYSYEQIYPCDDQDRMDTYKPILAKAKSLWIESTSGPANKKPAKPKNPVKSPTKKILVNSYQFLTIF